MRINRINFNCNMRSFTGGTFDPADELRRKIREKMNELGQGDTFTQSNNPTPIVIENVTIKTAPEKENSDIAEKLTTLGAGAAGGGAAGVITGKKKEAEKVDTDKLIDDTAKETLEENNSLNTDELDHTPELSEDYISTDIDDIEDIDDDGMDDD